mgnify:FL=1
MTSGYSPSEKVAAFRTCPLPIPIRRASRRGAEARWRFRLGNRGGYRVNALIHSFWSGFWENRILKTKVVAENSSDESAIPYLCNPLRSLREATPFYPGDLSLLPNGVFGQALILFLG